MCKLGILDSARIMGKTLGHTVKLPAAVTYITLLISYSFYLPSVIILYSLWSPSSFHFGLCYPFCDPSSHPVHGMCPATACSLSCTSMHPNLETPVPNKLPIALLFSYNLTLLVTLLSPSMPPYFCASLCTPSCIHCSIYTLLYFMCMSYSSIWNIPVSYSSVIFQPLQKAYNHYR